MGKSRAFKPSERPGCPKCAANLQIPFAFGPQVVYKPAASLTQEIGMADAPRAAELNGRINALRSRLLELGRYL